MGMGRQFKKKNTKKEWTSFDKLEEMQKRLHLFDLDIISICCSSGTFYRWKRKGKVPATTLSVIREELARYYKKEYDEKLSYIYNDED
jgi:hypothetical protein